MATETLSIPEESLKDVVLIIRMGLAAIDGLVAPRTAQRLAQWCDNMEGVVDLCHDDAASDERQS